jgi:hypothetical protein
VSCAVSAVSTARSVPVGSSCHCCSGYCDKRSYKTLSQCPIVTNRQRR